MGKIRIERNVSVRCVGPAINFVGPAEAFADLKIAMNTTYGGGGIASVEMFRRTPVILTEIVLGSDLPDDVKNNLVSKIAQMRRRRKSSKSILRKTLELTKIYPAVRTLIGDFAYWFGMVSK